MSKFLTSIAILLLFNLGLFAGNGRVIADIVYDQSGVGQNIPLRLISYYDSKARSQDYVMGRLQTILSTQRLNGTRITNIKASPLKTDKDGNYSIDFTYDLFNGETNIHYTIKDINSPVDAARNSVLTQVQDIQDSMTIEGNAVSNLKVGNLQEVPGGFRVDMTFDLNSQPNNKYHIDEFYDPMKKARDYVEDQLMDIAIFKTVNGTAITNLKEGDIKEVPGGYSADITYDEALAGGLTNVKYNIDDFYDAKMISKDVIHDQIQNVVISQMVNGEKVQNVKASDITDDTKNGKFTGTLTYILASNGQSQKLVMDSYYDPVSKATNDVQTQIDTIKQSMQIYGTPITNLRIGKIQVL